MKLTLQIQLLPDAKQAVALRETLARFNEAASWLAEKAFELRSANKIKLQQLFYADIRQGFQLSAQMTCAASRKSAKPTSAIRVNCRAFASTLRCPLTNA